MSPSVAVVVDAGLVVDVLRPNPGGKPGVVVDSTCRGIPGVVVLTAASVQHANTELSVGWVDSWVGLGWSGWVEIFFQFLVGWVGSTTAKIAKKLTGLF